MTNEPTKGGPEWERNEAAKQIGAGVQAGDADAVIEGADRLGDAVVNGVTSKLFRTLKVVFDESLKEHVAPIGRNQIDLSTKVNQWQHDGRIQLDAFKDSQDAILAAIQEVRGEVGKTQADITAIVERMDARDALNDERHEASRDFQQQTLEHRERLDAAVAVIGARLDSYIAGSKRSSVAALERDVEAIKKELKELRRQGAERDGDGDR